MKPSRGAKLVLKLVSTTPEGRTNSFVPPPFRVIPCGTAPANLKPIRAGPQHGARRDRDERDWDQPAHRAEQARRAEPLYDPGRVGVTPPVEPRGEGHEQHRQAQSHRTAQPERQPVELEHADVAPL